MFRFSIRDLLWLMLVVGMALVWWADRMQADKHRRESDWNMHALISLIESKGFVVRTDKRGVGIREANGQWSGAMSRDQDSIDAIQKSHSR